VGDTIGMTATRKTTVTHPDGTVSARASQSRAYTHAIQISPAPAESYAMYLINKATALNATAISYRQAAADAVVTIRDRGFGDSSADSLYSHHATLSGTGGYIYTWCSSDGQTRGFGDDSSAVSVREHLVAYAIEMAETNETEADKLVWEAKAIIAAGEPVGQFRVVRWSSSRALALKAMTEFSDASQQGCRVRVVPVD
jgi:hypothetical protein